MEILTKAISLIISIVVTTVIAILSIRLAMYLYNLTSENISEFLQFVLVVLSFDIAIAMICCFVPITCIIYLISMTIILHIIEFIESIYDWIKDNGGLAYSKIKNNVNKMIRYGYKHKRNKIRRT